MHAPGGKAALGCVEVENIQTEFLIEAEARLAGALSASSGASLR